MSIHRTTTLLTACLLSVSAPGLVSAQEMPKRKPGLWEMTMEMQGGARMPPMASSQCVDETSDAAMQRRALAGQPGTECSKPTSKRIQGGVEVQAECTGPEGKSQVVGKITGDMQATYAVDSLIKFTPPRHGMSEAHMVMQGRYAGPCPAGMKGGDMRVGGMTLNPSQAAKPGVSPGMPPGLDAAQIQNLTPAQRQQLMEQMKKMRPPSTP
ncbi:MAG: DUF3617 family protein [Burkholderiales bacterium]